VPSRPSSKDNSGGMAGHWSEKKWNVFGYAAEARSRALWVDLLVLRETESCLILKFDKVGKAAFWAEILKFVSIFLF
jgi:hypothetical protein